MHLTHELQDKSLRVEFNDGEIADIKVLVVSECGVHEDCRGVAYDLISTNRANHAKKGSAYWADSRDIKSFKVIGEPT